MVVVEAEHFDKRVADPADETHTWKIIPDEDAGTGDAANLHARGGKYIESLPDAGQNKNADASVVGTEPYVDYKVFIKTPGTYRLSFVLPVGTVLATPSMRKSSNSKRVMADLALTGIALSARLTHQTTQPSSILTW